MQCLGTDEFARRMEISNGSLSSADPDGGHPCAHACGGVTALGATPDGHFGDRVTGHVGRVIAASGLWLPVRSAVVAVAAGSGCPAAAGMWIQP